MCCIQSTSTICWHRACRVLPAKIASSLFDLAAGGSNRADVGYAREQALQLCAACPCLQRCRDWFTSLPKRDRPHGVVAGVLNTKRSSHTPW